MHSDPSQRPCHIDAWIADYALGRLESVTDREIEAHLLVCDRCFAALVAEVVIGPRTRPEPTPA